MSTSTPKTSPTLASLAQQIEALTLDTNQRFQNAEAVITEKTDVAKALQKRKAKIAMPPRYNGDPLKLKAWIAQCRAYFDYYVEQFDEEEDKVLFAGALLDGSAALWFQPVLDRYTRRGEYKNLSKDDQKIFDDFDGFEKALEAVFGEPDGKRRAEQRLIRLKQTGSTAALVGQYRAIHPQTDLNDAAVMMLFYLALKPQVQRRLAELDRPKKLDEYYEMAVKIDNIRYPLPAAAHSSPPASYISHIQDGHRVLQTGRQYCQDR